MTKIVEYTDGILFEIDDEGRGERRLAQGVPIPEKLSKSFEVAMEQQVKPLAKKLIDTVRGLGTHQVELELGIKMMGEVGAIVSKVSSEAHMVIKITWKAPDANK